MHRSPRLRSSARDLCAALLLAAPPAWSAVAPATPPAAAAAAAGDSAGLPPCIAAVGGGFLAVREYVVLDRLERLPPALSGRPVCTVADYLQALGPAPAPTFDADWSDALVVATARGALVVHAYRTLVRRSAISVIDERPGAIHALPATPVVPGGAQALAQPCSEGVTLGVGSCRVFCGVRSVARSLAVGDGDIHALACLVRAPDAEALLLAVSDGPRQ